MEYHISSGQAGGGADSDDVMLRDFAAVPTGQTVLSGLSESPYVFPASGAAVFCSGFTVGPDPEPSVYSFSGSDGNPVVTPDVRTCASPGDTLLPYVLPHAEYMYGCTATSVGMLLGYYDLYGYSFNNAHYDFSDLIEGTVSVDSRGSNGGSIYDMDDPSVLARFIASPEYVSRFYEQTPEHELPYTYVNSDPDQGLNISVWNCLADYLGTGQYWRGNDDFSTSMYYATLDHLLSNEFTYTVTGSFTIPAIYHEFKYGLYLYADARGFQLDTTATRTVEIGDFSFEAFKAEIDAGRPVLLSMRSGGYGHMVIAYGYNAASQEVIFDDTYQTGCRMEWDGTYNYSGDDYALDAVTPVVFDVSDLTPTVENHSPVNLQGEPSGLSWTGDSAGYEVQYSTDDFATVMQVAPGTSALDSYGLPTGTYQWRVCSAENGEWVAGNSFSADAAGTAPRLLQSDADGDIDVFFARASGTWNASYYAQHQGSLDGWTGTVETVELAGKNRIADIFAGSDDANVLLLTDDANGDALFVDDIYSALPGSVAEQGARVAQINEIRAGAGDDIVDLTSQRFEYSGDGMTIRGGLGNDTIWANKGGNMLFGDAGNDRLVGASGNDVLVGGSGNDSMNGGGGSDIFAFGENWGKDTVEQLADGEVTLWFASGDISKWNADTLTYADGENSVKVSGVTADKVSLKFGNDGSEQYGTLSASGAFAENTSEKIFEENKGILA